MAETAVVTGAGRGIGKAIADKFAREGYRVIVLDRDGDVAVEAGAQLRQAGHDAAAEALDVSDRAAATAFFERVGRVDVLVNNAGINTDMVAFTDISPERLRQMLVVNLLGVFIMAQEAVRRMQAGARIVNIASRGYLGGAGASHYVASKSGVVSLTRAMGIELRWSGITVNCVAPGMVDTRMMSSFTDKMRDSLARREPRGGPAAPSEIADVVAFLASPAASFMNGQVLLVDGGKCLGMPPF